MKHAPLLSFCLLLWFCCVRPGLAETIVASTNPARKGSGDLSVSFQRYYNRVNGAAASNVQGGAVFLRQFFPRSGLLTLQIEPVTQGRKFALGENYAKWSGLPWMNRHWDFAAGDFRSPTSLVDTPFANLSLPEIALRGASATARSGEWTYSIYGGAETLSQGSRVPYRTRVPQSAFGAESVAKFESSGSLGFRYLHLGSSKEDVTGQKLFFPVNRQFTASDTFTSQVDWKFTHALEWYSEAGWSGVTELNSSRGSQTELSYVAGPALHTAHLTLRANYLSQGSGYLPLVGYYLGDRRGANADGVWYLGPLSLNGNWSEARNNREHDPNVPDYFSRQGGGGVQVRLPASFYLSGSMSRLHFESSSSENGLTINNNRQFQIMIGRPIYRHNLHATLQRVDTEVRDTRQRLEFGELEDNYTWSRISVGGAARWQRVAAEQLRQSLFVRSSGQLQLRHLAIYGYWEKGKDLADQTLFATQISSTSVFGMTWEAPGAFTLRGEVFRNRLNSVVNPESLFVLGGRGVIPDGLLSRSDDWSLFLRVSREISWGDPGMLGSQGLRQPEAPLTGTLAGYVRLRTMEGQFGASDVWLVADTGQSVKTDANGYFQLPEVAQGTRIVKLDLDRLPADMNPPEQKEISVDVRSGQLSRVDMAVSPLAALEGTVSASDGSHAGDGIVLHLLPQDLYTSTDSDGRFGFYNLPEGEYEVTVADGSLPEYARLVSPGILNAAVQYGKAAPLVEFRYEVNLPGPKPTKKVLTDRGPRPVPASPASSKAAPSAGKRRVIVRTTAENMMPTSDIPTAGLKASSAAIPSETTPLTQSRAKWVAR